ncbi:hypothetical protein LBMAG52_36960 [Planctomycetia bacterium]|nr:hypothetical protein LBMAG52_36960 [Planctomycetia bacterium]
MSLSELISSLRAAMSSTGISAADVSVNGTAFVRVLFVEVTSATGQLAKLCRNPHRPRPASRVANVQCQPLGDDGAVPEGLSFNGSNPTFADELLVLCNVTVSSAEVS